MNRLQQQEYFDEIGKRLDENWEVKCKMDRVSVKEHQRLISEGKKKYYAYVYDKKDRKTEELRAYDRSLIEFYALNSNQAMAMFVNYLRAHNLEDRYWVKRVMRA